MVRKGLRRREKNSKEEAAASPTTPKSSEIDDIPSKFRQLVEFAAIASSPTVNEKVGNFAHSMKYNSSIALKFGNSADSVKNTKRDAFRGQKELSHDVQPTSKSYTSNKETKDGKELKSKQKIGVVETVTEDQNVKKKTKSYASNKGTKDGNELKSKQKIGVVETLNEDQNDQEQIKSYNTGKGIKDGKELRSNQKRIGDVETVNEGQNDKENAEVDSTRKGTKDGKELRSKQKIGNVETVNEDRNDEENAKKRKREQIKDHQLDTPLDLASCGSKKRGRGRPPKSTISSSEQPSSSTFQPSSSAFQPSSSTPVAKSSKENKLMGPGGKLLVMVTPEGCVMGPNAATFSTRSSEAVRTCVPINSSDWRTVDSSFKDDIWTKIMEDFEFNVDLAVARPMLEPFFSQRLRTKKHYYRSKILDRCESMQEQISKCPDDIDPNHWKDFVIAENSSKALERRKKNAVNRSKHQWTHTNGRRTYAQCLYNEVAKNPGAQIRRVDMWYNGHVRADGTVLESSREAYEQVKAADERLKETSTEHDMSLLSVEINSDALHEVFGPDKKSGTRGISSNISQKRLQQTSLAKSVLVGSSSEIAEVKGDVAGVKGDVAGIKATVNKLESDMGTLKELVTAFLSQQGSQPPPLTPINRTEIGSSLVNLSRTPNQNVPHNYEVTPVRAASKVNPKVKVLNKEGVVVATGYAVTDGVHAGICHGKKLGLGEKKVYIETVLIPDTPIYDAPQDGCNILEDIVEGGFLIWLDCRLKY